MLVITDRFNKMTRCAPLWYTTAATVTAAILEYWIYAYGAHQYLLTEKGKHSLPNPSILYAENGAPNTISSQLSTRRQT